jgi:hypothetical protein
MHSFLWKWCISYYVVLNLILDFHFLYEWKGDLLFHLRRQRIVANWILFFYLYNWFLVLTFTYILIVLIFLWMCKLLFFHNIEINLINFNFLFREKWIGRKWHIQRYIIRLISLTNYILSNKFLAINLFLLQL